MTEIPDPIAYWEEPARVESFAAREPDHRLSAMVSQLEDPRRVRVLDLGSAAGRNTRFLAAHGLDVVALDAAPAMVARTRQDLARLLGVEAAAARARVGRMDDLSFAQDAAFDLVVALGIYHMAASEAELARALAETRRVLAPGGRVLVATFAPGTRLGTRTYAAVAGTRLVHAAKDGQRGCLLDAAALDEEMARCGLVPVEPTETVRREPRGSVRVVTNGLFAHRDGVTETAWRPSPRERR